MTIHAQSHYVTLDGLRLHYQVAGQHTGRLPLVFTHGGGPGSTAWSNFRHSAAELSKQRQCFFVDLPQFGGSAMVPVTGPVFTWHASKLSALFHALGIERAHLINQSFGSGVALRFAASHPDKVGRIITIGAQPVAGGVLAPLPLFSKHAATLMSDYFLADDGPSREKMARLIQTYELHDDKALDEQTLELRFQASNNPDFIDLLETAGAFGQWEDLLPVLPQVKAPVLMCWGLHDWFGGVDVPMLMMNRLPDARLHVFGNAAHHLQSECPQAFNELASTFLGDE